MASRKTAKKKTNQKGDEATRRKIIEAAKIVFSERPYNSASIRMIGKEGQFEYPLVHYYFKTKADLFETVVKEYCDEIYEADMSFFDGVMDLGPRKGLEAYLDRFLDFHFKNPHYLRLIMLNFTQNIEENNIPGYHLLTDLVARARETFKNKIPVQADDRDILMYTNSFVLLLFAYVGSRSGTARTLGMDPESEEYKQWIKESLLNTYLPFLKKIIFGK
jgi:AcrR family transcriptional regulator